MNVKELKMLLAHLPDDTLVVINNKEVTGIEVVHGKITEGYFGKQFEANPKSRKKVVTFTHMDEISTGEVEPTRYWPRCGLK